MENTCKDALKEKRYYFRKCQLGIRNRNHYRWKIYKGKSGFSGEFGHISTFDNEIICHCGKKGCLETEASGSALHRTLLERIKKGENSILSERINMENPLTLDEIIAAVNKEDVLCIEIVEEIGQN